MLQTLRLKSLVSSGKNIVEKNLSKISIQFQNKSTVTENSKIDEKDIKQHASFAEKWWDSPGPLTPLHSLNEIRVPFIRDGLVATNVVNSHLTGSAGVLEGVKILEVGCGGGILTESLARIHANIVGVDPGEDVIEAAKKHLQNSSPQLKNRITYRNESIELHTKENPSKYDAVVVSEVLEHVNDKAQFLSACVNTLKPGGSIFITTFDKSLFSLIAGVWLAEYVLRIVPAETHDWNKFVSPVECQRILDTLNCQTVLVNGFLYEFWSNTWRWIPSTKSSYALQAVKTQ